MRSGSSLGRTVREAHGLAGFGSLFHVSAQRQGLREQGFHVGRDGWARFASVADDDDLANVLSALTHLAERGSQP